MIVLVTATVPYQINLTNKPLSIPKLTLIEAIHSPDTTSQSISITLSTHVTRPMGQLNIKVQRTTNNDGSPFNVQNDGNPFNDPNDGSPFNVQNDGNPFLNGLLGLSRAGRIAVVACVVRAAAVWIGERISAIGVIKMTFVAVVRLLVRMAVARVMCGIAVVRLVRDSPSNTNKLGQIKFSTKSMRLPSIWFSEGSSSGGI